MRGFSLGATLMLLLATAGGKSAASQDVAWYPKQFAATVRVTDADTQDEQLIRYYVGDRKFRMAAAGDGGAGGMILHFDSGTTRTIILDEAGKQYVEISTASEPGDEILGSIGSPEEMLEDCEEDPSTECRNEGEDELLGRTVQKWTITETQDGSTVTTTAWLDLETYFPLRTVSSEGERLEVVEIEVGPQPASLFEVPEGYRRSN